MRNNKMDFTLKIYKQFLHSLLANDYSFQTLENFIEHPNKEKIVILRHDVDRLPWNALVIAKIEKEAGGQPPAHRGLPSHRAVGSTSRKPACKPYWLEAAPVGGQKGKSKRQRSPDKNGHRFAKHIQKR